MKIAIDAMGGDHAPATTIEGALIAAREHSVALALVGPEGELRNQLRRLDASSVELEIVHTDQYLAEGEQPAYALREKRDASVLRAVRLVKEGRADAAVSAGPTGGSVAAALQVLGTLGGLSRPVVGGTFLGFAPDTVVADLGGNVDARPEQLLEFGVAAAVYAKTMLGIANPTVGLLSIGAEEGKGNSAVKASYPLFKESGLNFIGNVEGHDIPLGRANVVVCDGFVGNILVKFTEALGKATGRWLAGRLAGKVAQPELESLVEELTTKTNAAGALGGGVLWGVDGVVCVTHGDCSAREFSRSVALAAEAVETGFVATLKRELSTIRE